MKAEQCTYHGGTLNYGVDGKGELLVFLHGVLLSGDIWEIFARRFTHSYRTLLIDLPGHGGSSSFPPVHSMELMAEAVNAILEKENAEKVHLVAHSMGGYVALALLELFPGKIKSLVLLNSHPFADTPAKKRYRERQIQLFGTERKELLTRKLFSELFRNTAAIDPELVTRQLEAALLQCSNSLMATYRGMQERPDRSHLLRDLGIPLLWLLGSHDRQLDSEWTMANCRKARLALPKLLPGGHLSFLEEPERVSAEILNFLQQSRKLSL